MNSPIHRACVKCKISEFEDISWNSFALDHDNMTLAQANLSPDVFWSISDQYPDLVCCLHVQVTLMCSFGQMKENPGLQILIPFALCVKRY